MKSVIVAFSNPVLSGWVSTVLKRAGYTVESVCKSGGDLVRLSGYCTSPVAVVGFQFTDMTAEDLLPLVNGKLALITLLLPHQRDLPEREDLVWAPYPLSPADLIRSVEETERQAALNALRGEAQAPEKKGPEGRSAEERLLILKAKNTLMEGRGMTEAQAHRFLQKSSMDRGLKLIDAARMVMEKSLDVL